MVPEKAESIRQRYGAERAYTDYQQMLEVEKPDLVCIATRPRPARRHYCLRCREQRQRHLLRETALLLYGGGRCDG